MKILILLSLLCFFSCRDKSHDLLTCELSLSLVENDRELRLKHMSLLTPELFYLDSLLVENGYSGGLDDVAGVDFNMRLKLKSQSDSIYESRRHLRHQERDSIMEEQKKRDLINTKSLLSALSGFSPNDYRLQDECLQKSFIVFVHSPQQLHNEIQRKLDYLQFQKIDSLRFNHIMWHLNGRVETE